MKITVKVIPRSSKNTIQKLLDGSYKVKLTAPPVDGKANEQLLKLLAKEFGVAKGKITINKGETNRVKVIEIDK